MTYKRIAKYYDSIYHWKDYRKESQKVHKLIKKHKRSGGNCLLDVTCGSGNHLQYLKKYYEVTGLDASPDMLRVARSKFRNINFIKGDMRTFRLRERFDVIITLFSSIAHLQTYRNLEKALRNISGHLKPGGIVIIEPFIRPKNYIKGMTHAIFVNDPGLKIARMDKSRRSGNMVHLELHHLIFDKESIEYFISRFKLMMFETDRIINIMRSCGLKVRQEKDGLMKGRALLIGLNQA